MLVCVPLRALPLALVTVPAYVLVLALLPVLVIAVVGAVDVMVAVMVAAAAVAPVVVIGGCVLVAVAAAAVVVAVVDAEASWGHLGAYLQAILWTLGAILRPSWGHLGASRAHQCTIRVFWGASVLVCG